MRELYAQGHDDAVCARWRDRPRAHHVSVYRACTLLLGAALSGCAQSSSPTIGHHGHHYQQGCIQGRRVEVNCFGQGSHYACRNTLGESWKVSGKLPPYNETFDATYECMKDIDTTPTIQTTVVDEWRARGFIDD